MPLRERFTRILRIEWIVVAACRLGIGLTHAKNNRKLGTDRHKPLAAIVNGADHITPCSLQINGVNKMVRTLTGTGCKTIRRDSATCNRMADLRHDLPAYQACQL